MKIIVPFSPGEDSHACGGRYGAKVLQNGSAGNATEVGPEVNYTEK